MTAIDIETKPVEIVMEETCSAKATSSGSTISNTFMSSKSARIPKISIVSKINETSLIWEVWFLFEIQIPSPNLDFFKLDIFRIDWSSFEGNLGLVYYVMIVIIDWSSLL